MKAGGDAAVIAGNAYAGTDKILQGYLKNVGTGTASWEGFVKYEKQAVESTKKMALSSRIAALGINVLKTALNGMLIGLIGYGVTELVKWFDSIILTSKEAGQNLDEITSKWDESSQSLKSTKDIISQVGEEYSELSIGVDSFGNNVSLTSDEFKRYHDIANQIADLMPELVSGWDSQGNAILKTKGNVDALNQSYDDLVKKSKQAILSGSEEFFTNYTRNSQNNPIIETPWSDEAGYFAQTEYIDKLLSSINTFDLSKPFSEIGWDDTSGVANSIWDGLKKSGLGDPETVSDFIGNLTKYKNILISGASSDIDTIKSIADAYLYLSDSYNAFDDSTKSGIDKIVDSMSYELASSFESNLDLYGWIEDIILEPLKDIDLSGIISAKSLFDTNDISVGDYQKIYSEFITGLSGLPKETQDALANAFIPDTDALIRRVDNILVDTENFGLTDNVDKPKELTLAQLNIAANLEIPEGTLLTWSQLYQMILDVQSVAAQSIDAVKSTMESVNTQGAALNSAIEEQNENGFVTYDTYQALIDANTKYADSFEVIDGKLRINEDSAYAIADAYNAIAISEANAAESAKNEEIVKNANDILDITQQIQEMRKTGETGAAYDALIEQRDTLLSTRDVLEGEYQQYQAITSQIKTMGGVHTKVLDKIIEKYETMRSVIDDRVQVEQAKIDLLIASGKEVGDTDYADLMFAKKGLITNLENELSSLKSELARQVESGIVLVGTEVWKGYDQTIKETEAALYSANADLIAQQDTINNIGVVKLQFDMDSLDEQKSQIKRALETMESAGAAGTIELYTALIDIGDKQIENLLLQNDELEKELEGLDIKSEKYQDIGKQINENRDAIYDVRKAQEEWNDSIANLPVAKIRLAEETTNAGDNYESLSDIADNLKESAKSGKIVNDDIQSVVDFMLGGSSAGMSYEEQMQRVKDAQKKYERYFTEDNTGVGNFNKDLLAAGLITKKDGKISLGDGVTGETIMKSLGLSQDALITMFKNLEEYGGEFDWGALFPELTQEEIDSLEDQPSVINQEAQKLVDDAGLYGKYADEAVKAITAANQRISDALSGKKTIQSAQPTGGNSLFTAGESNESTTPSPTQEQSQGVNVNVDITMTEEDAATLAAVRELSEKTLTISATADIETAQASITTFGDNLEAIIIDVNADTTAALTQANILKDKIEDLHPTVWVTVKKTAGSALASGTKHAKAGSALVGERGREIVETNGGYVLVEEPTILPLNEGDRVHKNADTEKILRRSASSVSKVGQAFAGGTPSGTWNDISSSSSSATKSKKAASKSTSWQSYFEQLFDWIEIRLDRLSTITDRWTKQIKDAIGYIAKNDTVDATLKSIADQIAAMQEASSKYIGLANAAQKKSGLSNGIVNKIKNGSIDIDLYDKKTQEKIAEYQKWYDKALDMQDAIEDLKDQQDELNAQRLDNISQQYENMQGVIDNTAETAQSAIDLMTAQGREVTANDYATLLDAQAQKIARLREEQAALNAEFNAQVASGAITQGSDEWYEYKSTIDELDSVILDANADLIELNDTVNELTITKLGYQLENLTEQEAVIQRQLDIIESQGGTATDSLYEDLIAIGFSQIEILKAQNVALSDQLVGLDPMSEKYQDISGQIRDNYDAINDVVTSQEQWNDSVYDLKIDEINRVKDALSEANDEYQRQADLQKAIADLERARSQRQVRILENGTFKYVADQEAIADAQKNLDDKRHDETMAKFDEAIETLEELKKSSNVYETLGLTQIDPKDLIASLGVDDFLKSVIETTNLGAMYADLIAKATTATSATGTPAAALGSPNVYVTFAEGSISTQANADDVVSAITRNLAPKLEQELYKK